MLTLAAIVLGYIWAAVRIATAIGRACRLADRQREPEPESWVPNTASEFLELTR